MKKLKLRSSKGFPNDSKRIEGDRILVIGEDNRTAFEITPSDTGVSIEIRCPDYVKLDERIYANAPRIESIAANTFRVSLPIVSK